VPRHGRSEQFSGAQGALDETGSALGSARRQSCGATEEETHGRALAFHPVLAEAHGSIVTVSGTPLILSGRRRRPIFHQPFS
jgi:hypothetical protein